MNIWIASFFAIPASMFYAMSIHAPLRSVPISAVCGLIGQLIYTALLGSGEYVAVFAATLAVCVMSEICARVFRTPATVLTYPSLTPLVPGLLLYKAMLAFSQSDYTGGAVMLMSALIYAGCMAVAITAAAVFAKHCITPVYTMIIKRKQNGK